VRPPNHLAFSCEAARVIVRCSQNAARLRLLQWRVGWQRVNLEIHEWFQAHALLSRAWFPICIRRDHDVNLPRPYAP